jgi:hypothetical protein
VLRFPPKKRTLKKHLTSPKCSLVSTTTTNDPGRGRRWAMPKKPGTDHSVYLPTGNTASRHPGPSSGEAAGAFVEAVTGQTPSSIREVRAGADIAYWVRRIRQSHSRCSDIVDTL